jgi:hypothetical protein
MGPAVPTTIGYLARDKRWSREKPYTARFDVSQIPGAQQSNHSFETRNVTIRDARDHGLFDLDQNGFTFAKCSSILSGTQLEDAENIKNIYFPEVARALRELKPYYSELMLVDYEVRPTWLEYIIGTLTNTFRRFGNGCQASHCRSEPVLLTSNR